MTAADTRVTTRNLPWHGVSTALSETQMTSSEALELSGLDWEVDLKPLFFRVRQDGKDRQIRASKQVVFRKDSLDEVGIVGSRYVPFQNKEAFGFLDHLVADGGASFQAAGTMNGGSRVYVVVKTPETIKVLGDEHDTYVLFMTSHDGSMSVTATTTIVRLACTNMFRAALTSDRPIFKANHIGAMMDPESMVAAARETLGVTRHDQEAFSKLAGRLAAKTIGHDDADDAFYSVMRTALPWESKATAKEIEGIRTLWLTSDTINEEHRFTGWGLANATTEYLSHMRSSRSGEAQLKRALGVNGQVESRLAKAILAS